MLLFVVETKPATGWDQRKPVEQSIMRHRFGTPQRSSRICELTVPRSLAGSYLGQAFTQPNSKSLEPLLPASYPNRIPFRPPTDDARSRRSGVREQ